ncbi:MAG: LapA family protein [Ardenticatenaceae bacterium]
MNLLRIIFSSILFVLFLILLAQNTDIVTVRMFLWEFSMSRIILLSGTLLTGFLIGYLMATINRFRRR